eukprot:gene43527-53218_t
MASMLRNDVDYSYVEPAAQAGLLQLFPEDASNLSNQLLSNTGSKDSIKAIRKWILERAHSAVHIAHIVCEVVGGHMDRGVDFALRSLYVLNDVFYQASSASSRGAYTLHWLSTDQPVAIARIFLPYVALVMQCVGAALSASASSGAQREKLEKLLGLWASKGFVSAAEQAGLLDALRQLPEAALFLEIAQRQVWSNASSLKPPPPPPQSQQLQPQQPAAFVPAPVPPPFAPPRPPAPAASHPQGTQSTHGP